MINCNNDYQWEKVGNVNKTNFSLNVMKKYSYLNEHEFINPITEEDIGVCLIVNVTKDDLATTDITLDDSKCKK